MPEACTISGQDTRSLQAQGREQELHLTANTPASKSEAQRPALELVQVRNCRTERHSSHLVVRGSGGLVEPVHSQVVDRSWAHGRSRLLCGTTEVQMANVGRKDLLLHRRARGSVRVSLVGSRLAEHMVVHKALD